VPKDIQLNCGYFIHPATNHKSATKSQKVLVKKKLRNSIHNHSQFRTQE